MDPPVRGKAWKYGDNIDTDVIIPARYLNLTDPEDLAAHCFEDYDPEFRRKVSKQDILIAGENFGCGSSREHAVIALQASGISAIVAKSYARIFFRNAINCGLPVIESKTITDGTDDGDEVEINIWEGSFKNLDKDESYQFPHFPSFIQEIFRSGGLINLLKKTFTEGDKKEA